ncbi:MAG TPA: NBR1-Ig-like domain-containing protein [Anaerolineales bacterium]|nr:NBR1-Ig-like domain-containing protein [Anaerolineales bacterium]
MFGQKILSMVLLAGMLLGQSLPNAYAATFCDQAQFVSDITVPDGTAFAPGTAFTKTWRFANAGTCTWTTSYSLVQFGGDAMGAPLLVSLPVNVPPGQTIDVSINLTAPTIPGHYKGLWNFINASGMQFGIGDSAANAFWVDINVIATDAVIYDFVANAPYAKWKSGAGYLPYPGTSGDSRGFSYQIERPHLEDDSFDSLPGLLTVPQNKYNGYIQATYPELQIQQGDKLQTLVNCEFGATGCYVTFRIDYLLQSGAQKTLWQFKEAYDKRFYRANIDLSPLAGQKVRFVFMLLSTGFASNDRAIWGSPRIVRAGTVQPPAPPATLTPLPPLTPTQTPLVPPPPTIAPSGCDRATFITDVNVPDGTIFAPGAAFSKTWRIKNSGYCAWTRDYKLMYYSGEQMGAPTSINMPLNVFPGETVDLTVNMVAPNSPGEYRGFWIFANANGTMFGIGTDASKPFWVEINVTGGSPIPLGYDFTANACSAQWKSGAGYLPCPGTDGDSKGFMLIQNTTKLEDGSIGGPGLLTFPQYKYNGYIQGYYPTFTVQPGDRFQTSVGCEYGSSCYVTFMLQYMTPNGGIFNFWTWREQNQGKYSNIDIDLSPLAGKSVRFILTLLATGYASNDRAVWGSPRIFREGGALPTITPVPPTGTPTPSTGDWPTYTNSTYGFQFKYPPQAQIYNQFPESLLMNLPIIPGTNLSEKYLQTTVTQNSEICQSPLPQPPNGTSETVTINGITFLKQTGGDAGAGNFHDWVVYSTSRDNTCVSMSFILHYLNAGTSDPPQPEFDRAAESAVFTQMMSTFTWLALPSTSTPTLIPATATPIPPTLPSTPGTVVNSPNISSLHMIDAGNGWANSDSYLLRTTNGGGTWYSVLPNISEKITGGFFSNINTSWVITSSLQGGQTGPGSLYRTTNGGLNWTRYDVPFNDGYIQFLDNTGYVLQVTGAATSKQSVILYKSTDGGATWTTQYYNDPTIPGYNSSLPLAGHKNGMTFINGSTGWVGGESPLSGSIYLYKTSDNGLNWMKQDLPVPAGYENAYMATVEPKFFDPNNGILPVWMSVDVGARDLYLYVTHDGGNTWTPSSGFARNAQHTDIVSLSSTISWDWANLFHVTNNGGANWTTITPNINFGDDFRGLDFVSATTGWVFLKHPDNSTSLYRTADGGSTWTLLSGSGNPTPTNTPSVTQTLSHDAFCADTRVPLLIAQLKAGANQSNGSLISTLVSPTHGLDVRLWAYAEPVNFNAAGVSNMFSDTTIYNWGGGPSGIPDTGTFKDVIQPKLLEVLNAPNMEIYCDSLDKAYPLSNPWPYPNIRYYNLYKPGTPGTELDFRTWLIGFEYINGEPYLHSMVTIIWEP